MQIYKQILISANDLMIFFQKGLKMLFDMMISVNAEKPYNMGFC